MTNQTPRIPKNKIDGLILLDKPLGISSNGALQMVKRALRAEKAGHTGSLDPLASGLLPICLGQATKFSQFLLDADKTYQVTARFGIRTTTGDVEGEVVEERTVPTITHEIVEKFLDAFRGDILQVPSMYSALKHQGQPLYKYARQGIEIPREPRAISIYELRILNLTENTVELLVRCSKGTYIRSLIDDLGQALNCGAHVTVLRRLSVGPFVAEQMHRIEEINLENLATQLLPMQALLTGMQQIVVSPAIAFYLKQGQAVFLPKAPVDGLVALLQTDDKLIGVGEMQADGKIAPRRIVSV